MEEHTHETNHELLVAITKELRRVRILFGASIVVLSLVLIFLSPIVIRSDPQSPWPYMNRYQRTMDMGVQPYPQDMEPAHMGSTSSSTHATTTEVGSTTEVQ